MKIAALATSILPPADQDAIAVEHITSNDVPIRHFMPGKMDMPHAIKTSLDEALTYSGKLSENILAMDGMSGKKYRYFINNLVAHLQSPRYLEVGSWGGSTLCSAIYKNTVTATTIDNWSEFGGPVNLFFKNLSESCSLETKVNVINSDFRKVNYASLGTFNIYLFDGPHTHEDQRDGLAYALPCLENEFIFIVDDWNWQRVRTGTMEAIASLGLAVMSSTEIRTTETADSTPKLLYQHSDWHNGYFISILRKK